MAGEDTGEKNWEQSIHLRRAREMYLYTCIKYSMSYMINMHTHTHANTSVRQEMSTDHLLNAS